MYFGVMILAGGKGKRMKSRKSKVLHPLMGKTMIEWVIDTARELNPDETIIVYGKKAEEMVDMFSDVKFVLQPVPEGTADAVEKGLKRIEEKEGNVIILSADVPLLKKETVMNLFKYHENSKFDATVLTFEPDDPEGYGRIIYEGEEIVRIVEEKDASQREKEIKEVNGGIYVFSLSALRNSLSQVNDDNAQGEYYLTDVISIIRRDGGKIGGMLTENSRELYGVNTRTDLRRVIDFKRREKIKELEEKGVTFIMPDTVYIEPQVEIKKDTTIYPHVVIRGKTVIGENCIVKPYVQLEDSKIPPDTEIEDSV